MTIEVDLIADMTSRPSKQFDLISDLTLYTLTVLSTFGSPQK